MTSAPSSDPYILIVDDDPDTRNILSWILKASGWKSASVVDGAAALEQVAHHPPFLILLDLMMPGMNGFETLSALKKDPTTRPIPVIIISALGYDRRIIRLGASEVLTKGHLTPAVVQGTIAKVLGDSVLPMHAQAD
jgi:CheY-like chemotaxis protein